MNQVMLYFLWKRVEVQLKEDEVVVGLEVQYEFVKAVTNLDIVKSACENSNGDLVYTWVEAWYGEAG